MQYDMRGKTMQSSLGGGQGETCAPTVPLFSSYCVTAYCAWMIPLRRSTRPCHESMPLTGMLTGSCGALNSSRMSLIRLARLRSYSATISDEHPSFQPWCHTTPPSSYVVPAAVSFASAAWACAVKFV